MIPLPKRGPRGPVLAATCLLLLSFSGPLSASAPAGNCLATVVIARWEGEFGVETPSPVVEAALVE